MTGVSRFANPQSSNMNMPSQIICDFFRRRGHVERDCRTKRRTRRVTPRFQNHSKLVEANDSPPANEMLALQLFTAATQFNNDHISWYLD
eukprot:c29733_g1_i1 orf=1-267(-)